MKTVDELMLFAIEGNHAVLRLYLDAVRTGRLTLEEAMIMCAIKLSEDNKDLVNSLIRAASERNTPSIFPSIGL